MKRVYPFMFLMVSLVSGFSQNQKYLHQTFQLDTATTVRLDLFGEFAVEPWVGDAVMIETKVSLYNASEGILKHFIDEGRYTVEAKLEGKTLLLTSKDKVRSPIGTSKRESREEVTVRVFIPEKMRPEGANSWALPAAEQKKDTITKGSGG